MSRPKFSAHVRTQIASDLRRLYPHIDSREFLICLESAAYLAKYDDVANRSSAKQKDRTRTVARIKNAARNLTSAIAELDEDARWHLFGRIAAGKEDVTERDPLSASRAELEGAGYWRELSSLLELLLTAASNELPFLEHSRGELSAARSLFEDFHRFGIPFSENESSFASACVGHVFNLAGLRSENVRYWIGKARA